MKPIRYQEAMRLAVRDAMDEDSSVFYIGEDVRHALRGVSKGLLADFGPERVRDTPISEQAFTGFATGAAMAGLRPIVEFQIPSLLYIAFDQIVNQAGKLSLMTGGQTSVPVTYLIPGSGARRGLAGQHSDHPYSLLAHMGIKTVIAATAADAYGLLRSAVADADPVAFFAPAAVLGKRSVIERHHAIPLGEARTARSGDDATIVTVGHLVHEALDVAEQYAGEIDLEIVDLRTILPLDWDAVLESVRRTGRLVVVDDSSRTAGIAGDVVSAVVERVALKSLPIRITRADSAIPFSVPLEEMLVPGRAAIESAVLTLIEGEPRE